MICQGCCQDVNVSHKAVVNRDSLCFAFPDALRFVDLDMVNKLPQQWGGQLVHLHKLSDGSDKLVLIGRLPFRLRNLLPELWDLRFQGKLLYIVFVGNLQEALVRKKPFRILFKGLFVEPGYGFRAHQGLLQLALKALLFLCNFPVGFAFQKVGEHCLVIPQELRHSLRLQLYHLLNSVRPHILPGRAIAG